ncbi:MFS transporter [Alicyclobacillus contaminans]|uniref:MFS transporter n=1 Tax=Alicyclobacillus contaminans TaxID=392016 RepID=UPI0004248844|nr:MFS transporter [Alicyclobacillus contaminans]GMA50922.1 MFS transporter [Alicyclobacillus contaminans]
MNNRRGLSRLSQWLEPELFQPFVFGVLFSLTLSEFVRGALTLSLIPTYGRSVLGFAVEWTSLALSMHYLADNLMRSPAGWMADRFGQRTMLLAGFALSFSAVFWMMNAHSILSLIGSLALYGIGVTPMWPAAISGIGLATPEQSRARFMSYLYIFWMAGTGLGPVTINFLIGRTYTLAFTVLLAIDCAGFAVAWFLVRRPRDVGVRNPAEGASSPHRSVRRRRAYWQSLWRNVKEVAFLFPGMFAQTFAVASLLPILSLYAKIVLRLSGAMYSFLLIFGGAFAVVLLIPAGHLVDRFGPRRFLVPAFLIAGTALGTYPIFHTLISTFVVVAVLGCCYGFILPAWNSVLDKSIDPDKKGILWGVFMTVEGFGSAIGPYLGGLVWDTISPRAPFVVSAVVIFVMGLLYLVLPIERRNRAPSRTRGEPRKASPMPPRRMARSRRQRT